MFQGESARRIRDAKGITLRDLSLLTGLSIGHMSDCERHIKPNMPVETAQRWAKGLGVSLETIWNLDGPPDSGLVDLLADNALVQEIIHRLPSAILAWVSTEALLTEVSRRLTSGRRVDAGAIAAVRVIRKPRTRKETP